MRSVRPTAIAPKSAAERAREEDCRHSGGGVNRAAALGQAPPGAAGANGQHLGQDRDGGLGGRVRAEVQACQAGQPLELFLGEAGLEQPLAPLSPACAASRSRRRRRRPSASAAVRAGTSSRSSWVSTTTAVSALGGQLVRPGDRQLVRARQPFARDERGSRVNHAGAPAERLGGTAKLLRGVDAADDDQLRRRPEHLGEDAGAV